MAKTVLGTINAKASFFNVQNRIPRVKKVTPWIAGNEQWYITTGNESDEFSVSDLPLYVYKLPENVVNYPNASGSTPAGWFGGVSLGKLSRQEGTSPLGYYGSSGQVEWRVVATTSETVSDDTSSMVNVAQASLPLAQKLVKSAGRNKSHTGLTYADIPDGDYIEDPRWSGSLSLIDGASVVGRAFNRFISTTYGMHQLKVDMTDIKRYEKDGEESFGRGVKLNYESYSDGVIDYQLWVVLQDNNSIVLTDNIDEATNDGLKFKTRSEELSKELLIVAKSRDAGEDVKVPDRDLKTEFESYDEITREHAFEWLKAYDQMKAEVNASELGANSEQLLADYDKNKLDGESIYDYFNRKTTNTTVPGSSTWQTAWGAIKGISSKLVDYVASWPPTTWIAGYAGLTAVNSAKKSSVPPWLIMTGAGLLFLTLVKK